MQSQAQNLKVAVALNSSAISTDTTTAGVKIDRLGFDAVTFILRSGAVTDGTYTPLIEDSEDNTTFAPAVDTFLISESATVAPEAAAALTVANTVSKIGYVGTKRYVRLSIVSTSTSTGGTILGEVVLGAPLSAPQYQ